MAVSPRFRDTQAAPVVRYVASRPRNAIELGLVLILAFGAVLLLGVIGWPLTKGEIRVFGDLAAIHLPWKFFYAQCLRAGEDFIWYPSQWSGFYLHGEGQAGMFHPLHLLGYRFLPLAVAINAEIVGSYWLMAIGMILWLRRWALKPPGVIFGALVFAFSIANLAHYPHVNVIGVASHIPWILWCLDITLRDECPRWIAAAAGVSLLTASQILLGHPQCVWLSILAEATYFACVAGRLGWSRMGWVVGAKLLGILAGAVQILPTWDVFSASLRFNPPLEFRFSYALHPSNVLQLVLPYMFSWQALSSDNNPVLGPLYNGTVPALLAIWFLARRDSWAPRQSLARWSIIMGSVAFLLGFGRLGLLYHIVVHLPLVGGFRAPWGYTLLVHLAMAAAVAIALDGLLRDLEENRRMAWCKLWVLGLPPVASMLVCGFFLTLRMHSKAPAFLAAPQFLLLSVAVVLAGSTLLMASSRGRAYALLGLVGLALADQAGYGLQLIVRAPLAAVDSVVTNRNLPPRVDEGRILSRHNVLTIKGHKLASGYSALKPKTRLGPWDEKRLRIAGVRWVERDPKLGLSDELLNAPSPGRWIECQRPLPRVRLVCVARQSSDLALDMKTVDPELEALVEERLDLPRGEPGRAWLKGDAPGRIRVKTEAATKQLLVVAESYHSGWEASVDGRPRKVLRVYGGFMGCVVDAGRHKVEFRFLPKSFLWGRVISIGALFTLLACFVAATFSKNQRVPSLKVLGP